METNVLTEEHHEKEHRAYSSVENSHEVQNREDPAIRALHQHHRKLEGQRSLLDEQTLKRHLLEELLSKFERALLRSPLDPEDIEFVCRQQLYLMQALSRHVEIPIDIIQALQEVFEIVRQPPYSTAPHAMVVTTTGLRGRPRIERLWRDVRIMVTSKYLEMLHSLESEGLLDISVVEDLFSVHYTFLPRLQADLDTFAEAWNHHPLSTEGNRSPEQLWQIGLMQTNIDQLDSNEDIEEADLDWDVAASYEACEDLGVVVPEFECPLSSDGLNGLEDLQNLTGSNTPATEMYLLCREFVTTNIV
ncbi:hypothetical protein E1301_Tti021508 [Triplophysa tibetana]|uniref:Integrase core domain-containing protein n=1 Tax=Triplophysa tibetana TaxID=1572043 RepID=A0A5A9NVW9_9TELE|nr:hypothetical protein E1301_Tti021508 [Triplophysa tibetana]